MPRLPSNAQPIALIASAVLCGALGAVLIYLGIDESMGVVVSIGASFVAVALAALILAVMHAIRSLIDPSRPRVVQQGVPGHSPASQGDSQ